MDSPGPQGAPRFSSFKLPAPDTSQPSSRESDSRRHRSRPRQRADQHVSSRISRSGRSRRDDRDREATERRDLRSSGETTSDVKPESEKHETKFVIDIQGDRGITRYGADKYDIPSYHRSGSGFVIGLPDHRIDYETRHDDSLVLLRNDAALTTKSRPLSATAPAPWTSDAPIHVQPDRTLGLTDGVEHVLDFIPTSAPTESDSAAIATNSDGGSASYFLGSLSAIEEEVTTESSNGDKPPRITGEIQIMRRNAELQRAVTDDPHNIKAWIRLAEHQEIAALGTRYDDRPLNHAERQLVAKDKLQVYDSAIKANSKSPNREILVLRRMEEGAKVWDVPKLTHEWEEALCYHSEFIRLWIEYLDYCQSDAQDFQFDECFKAYVYCLKLHASVGFGREKAPIRAYLLLRLTLFLRESGHMELAVGLWQAVLEFVIFIPDRFADNKELALEEFKKLWVPEYTKIGEPNWIPWNGDQTDRAPVDRHSYILSADLPNLFGSWASAERERMIKNRMPSHSFEDFREDDTFRVILLEDCTQILKYFRDMDDGMGSLVDGFLQFCHLPHLTFPANVQTSRLWMGDSFLRNEYMDDPRNTIAGWINFHQYHATTTIEPFAFPHHTFIQTTDTLFADPKHWFSALTKWAANASHKSCVISSNFVLLTLHSLVQVFTDSNLAEYAIAVSFACDRDLGRKYGKRLLKEQSSDLRLYNAVALMHWRIDDRDTAHKVWSTALTMSQTFSPHELIDSVLLWSSWIWEMLKSGQNEKASYLLQAMPFKRVQMLAYDTADDFEFNNINIVRLKRFLSEAQDKALESRKIQAYTAYVDCYALIRYLMGASLKRIFEVYDTAVDAVEGLPKSERNYKTFGRELLHQARARLIYHYVNSQSGQFKPADVRDALLNSLKRWPHNTMFLSLYKWNDARLQLTDRTRDIFDVTVRASSRGNPTPNRPSRIFRAPVTTHLFNIYGEMGRPLISGSTTHSIRGAFERAIAYAVIPARKSSSELTSSTSAHNNVTLWKLYFLFELYAEFDVHRAREVYFRAVRSCPWSKDLYMLAFEHLRADQTRRLPPCRLNPRAGVNPPGFNTAELRALYSEMLHRGLRIHHHVEDFWAHKGEESKV